MVASLNILVAEDNRVLADVIQFNLEDEGFHVVVAHNGRKALKLAEKQAFDLIFCDYQMPGLSGEELLREIRANSISQNAVCVLCSAKGYELDVERLSKELDLMQVVLKPFSPNELVEFAYDAQALIDARKETRGDHAVAG
ncbi:response regulator [Thalassoroseus pseudoceratinae]|uniref:response regulator n=1 Tax=Thalassoroseus pseudoceratinae TaxID=2713176 RepID=UPI00141FFA3A|nr:response regulator [Thalassoroseus pseudoceratinae]